MRDCRRVCGNGQGGAGSDEGLGGQEGEVGEVGGLDRYFGGRISYAC